MSDKSPTERQKKAHSEVLTRVMNGIQAVTRELEDPQHLITTPMYDGDPWPDQRARGITELRVAQWWQNQAAGQVYRAACRAQGEGASWAEIAPHLDLEINGDPEASAYAKAEKAFERIAGWPGSFSDVCVCWDCGSCGGRIRDSGPYNSHPDDNESGHTETCQRHRAAVAAHETERERSEWQPKTR
jgi:hypothetical protein